MNIPYSITPSGSILESISPQPVDQSPSVPDFPHRRERALEHNRRLHGDIDALAISDPLDIHYLTGTRHGLSWLVLQTGSAFAVTRHMLENEVRAEAVDCEILLPSKRSTERAELEQFIFGEFTKRNIRTVAVDPVRLGAQSYLRLIHHAAARDILLHCIPDLITGLRSVKDPFEIALTRRCVNIAERAMSGFLAQGASALIGRSERVLADELECRMRDLGADRQGFPETGIIVASGPNSASAHHAPGHRRVAAGEPLLIDWGAEVSGYRSDLTRTIFLRSVPEFALQAYPVVEQALLRAAAHLRAGTAMGEIDRIARETITDAGYVEFHYGVGHGVGLAIHEAPWLRADSDAPCEADMITTIEPGIYLPGTGGIRIENLYQVTPDGNDCLANLPTDLRSMILG